MSGSTQTCPFEVEELLKSFGEALAARRLREEPCLVAGFDSRPIVAGFLAFLIFAPGCAAAAVFLMKTDGNVPAFVAPDNNASLIAKSDRLPLAAWGPEAASGAEARLIARLALVGPAFLAPVIRGSLEDAFVAAIPETVAAPDAALPAPATPKLRSRRETRRARPVMPMAEIVQPEATPPSFLEKLFGLRSL